MIVALHGNLGAPQDWDALGISGIRAVDLWQYSNRSFAEFAHEISHGDERPVLAGYSLGGRLALHAMAAYPERWSGAVIVSAHPGLPCVEDRIARRSSDATWAQRARELPWSEFLERWNAQPVLADSGISDGQDALESRRKAIASAFENWSLGLQEDLRPRLKRFSHPVLWVTGERDTKFTEIGREMAEVFSDYRHEIIPDCGHRVVREKPDELRETVTTFLKTARTGE